MKRRVYIAIGISCLLLLVLSFIPHSSTRSSISALEPIPEKAAIVDHLSISWPNPAFVKECTSLLRTAGYDVDYYKGDEVTVELYRHLPTHGYKLIILRTHSAYIHKYLSLAMFTSETYSKNRYVYEQLRNRVASGFVGPYQEGDPRYLVVTDKFVRYSMEGSFDDAIIVMMGCRGIKKCAATAFIGKGASVYIGWDGLVSARHTDLATIRFFEHFLAGKQTVAEAVNKTMKEIGIDSKHKSQLLFWPTSAAGLTIASANNEVVRAASE